MSDALPLLYTELANWFPLLSPPEEYAEEAALYRDLILAASSPRSSLPIARSSIRL